MIDQSDQKTHCERRSRRWRSMSPVSIPDTVNPFPGGRNAAARFRMLSPRRRRRSAVASPGYGRTGKGHLQLDVANPGGRSQADEGDRILFQELRFARDRRSARETRDEVIPQHDRSVKVGSKVTDRQPARQGLDPRPVPGSRRRSNPSTRPISRVPSSSSTRIKSGFALQNARACGLQQRMADGR